MQRRASAKKGSRRLAAGAVIDTPSPAGSGSRASGATLGTHACFSLSKEIKVKPREPPSRNLAKSEMQCNAMRNAVLLAVPAVSSLQVNCFLVQGSGKKHGLNNRQAQNQKK